MSEFKLSSVDDAREMLHWLARKRRVSLTALVKAAELNSASLVTFARLEPGAKRTENTIVTPLLRLLAAADHRLLATPLSSNGRVTVSIPGPAPMEIHGVGGGPLEVAIDKLEDIRTLGHTLAFTSGKALSALCVKAGISLGLVSFTNGSAEANDLQLSQVLKLTAAADFCFVVRPVYANRRDARLSPKKAVTASS